MSLLKLRRLPTAVESRVFSVLALCSRHACGIYGDLRFNGRTGGTVSYSTSVDTGLWASELSWVTLRRESLSVTSIPDTPRPSGRSGAACLPGRVNLEAAARAQRALGDAPSTHHEDLCARRRPPGLTLHHEAPRAARRPEVVGGDAGVTAGVGFRHIDDPEAPVFRNGDSEIKGNKPRGEVTSQDQPAAISVVFHTINHGCIIGQFPFFFF